MVPCKEIETTPGMKPRWDSSEGIKVPIPDITREVSVGSSVCENGALWRGHWPADRKVASSAQSAS